MTAFALVSDAHGDRRRMDALLNALPPVDALYFLGDMDKDAEYLDWGLKERQPCAAFVAVAGNNDPFSRRARTVTLAVEAIRVMLTHGHLFTAIRLSPKALAREAARQGCALACYGHTHRPLDKRVDGVRVVNPGALKDGDWALVTVDGAAVTVAARRVAVGG